MLNVSARALTLALTVAGSLLAGRASAQRALDLTIPEVAART